MVADPDSRYSDRHLMKAWNDEKDQLEKILTPKQTLDAYKKALKQRGYEITSVNDREADYVEYEIVKGDNSYEVQIDLDPTRQTRQESGCDEQPLGRGGHRSRERREGRKAAGVSYTSSRTDPPRYRGGAACTNCFRPSRLSDQSEVLQRHAHA
jgi:hypothetical protein